MNNAATISPMAICSALLAASVLAACGGGSSGSGPIATAAAAEISPSASAPAGATQTLDSSNVAATDTRPTSVQYAEAIATYNDGQTLLTSLSNVGANVSTVESAATSSADESGLSSTGTLVADASTATSVTALSVSSATRSIIKLTDENHSFTVPAGTTVRYGSESTNKWVTKTLSGYAECTNQFFGNDPSPYVVKVCEAITNNPAIAAAVASPIWSTPSGKMPLIDLSKIPSPWLGFTDLRVQATSEVAPASDIGSFRTSCSVAKMSFDDPIVFPGQAGKSHLHTFFGNTGADANSTPASLRTTGTSTCNGGIANRSAYWVPTIIDTRTGVPVVADSNGVYYKSGYDLPTSVIKPIPAGLRMIAGNPAGSAAGAQGARFKCVGGPNNENDKYGSSIGNCDAGAALVQEIMFPQCWDGVNLDSPDHKSHMAYPSNSVCPASHPVAIPAITFNVIYTVTAKNQATYWRLSSDNYDSSLPAGYSSHGDWFNGWKSDISDSWGKNCVMAVKDCHSHLVGDGRMMF